ncbi:PaaI family thioesterase [Variovorax sp. LjRoot290]|uniref:PaaI family thioesterase n=1 Tax=Variovorax sp. LjRoot290 TaxID=3342316 RepID=UPI003ECCCA9A
MSDDDAGRPDGDVDNPLLDYLGIERVGVAPGEATFELLVGPRHLNRQGKLQGGVTATLLDAACGYAGLVSDDGAAFGNAVTVMLNISYVRGVSAGRLRAVGKVTKTGRTMYFSSGELLAEDGRLLATAQGAFMRATTSPKG